MTVLKRDRRDAPTSLLAGRDALTRRHRIQERLGIDPRGRSVWESRKNLAHLEDPESESFVEEYVKLRTDEGLAHVFTLLSIVLPSEPLRIAYRALHTSDQALRGTALEYLESVLPLDVRQALWPFLDVNGPTTGSSLSRQEIVARLIHAHPTILANLRERAEKGEAPPAAVNACQTTQAP